MKKFLIILIVLTLFSFSTTDNKFQMKSGNLKQAVNMMGTGIEINTLFDEFGNKQKIKITSKINTIIKSTEFIANNGKYYQLDRQKKTYAISTSPEQKGYIDVTKFSETEKLSYNYKDIGEEIYLQRDCKKVSINSIEKKTSGTYWIYKNIVLKMDSKIMNFPVKLETKEFIELPLLNKSEFEIPNDFKLVNEIK
ncbi:MAG: hypothetical protein WCK02_02220 [Bacteroidota bacterium]